MDTRIINRLALIAMIAMLLSACTSLQGTVSTIYYNDPPQPSLFHVSPNSLSVTDRNISALIEAKLIEKGYQKATTPEAANVGVVYKYSFDSSGSVHSVPDYAVGGHATYTTYPRHFQIAVFDLRKPLSQDKITFLWQGEIYSAGMSRNIGFLAPYFIEVLFENYGQTVSNKTFGKVVQ